MNGGDAVFVRFAHDLCRARRHERESDMALDRVPHLPLPVHCIRWQNNSLAHKPGTGGTATDRTTAKLKSAEAAETMRYFETRHEVARQSLTDRLLRPMEA